MRIKPLSKFKDVKVRGNGNQFGNNNTQNNSTTNNTTNNHHHHDKKKKATDGSEAMIIIFATGAGFLVLLWWFFQNIDQVYDILNIVTLTSPALAVLSIVILLFSGALEANDIFRFLSSIVLALGLFGLAIMAKEYAPDEIIQLSHQSDAWEFWDGLNDHGKNLVLLNFGSALFIAFSALATHLISFRQLAYSLASKNCIGFWYRIYESSKLLKVKVMGSIIVVLSGVDWALLNGYLIKL
jgi:hypothetical protein